MAIISGFKPAEVDDVKPFELPIEDMAKGIMARQARADAAKNAFGLGASALAIDTRALQEDWDKSKELSASYSQEIQNLVDQQGGDWSKVDNSQIQAIATKYAQDDRTRQLIEAKQQSDLFLQKKRDLESQFGRSVHFGTDPTKDALYTADNKPNDMKSWKLEKDLDHIAKAQEMYQNIGHKLQEAVGWYYMGGKDGAHLSPEQQQQLWYDYWTKYWKQNKNNNAQIKAILDDAYNSFIYTDAGAQYKEKLERDYRLADPNIDANTLNSKVKENIQDLIAWTGKSKIIDETKVQSEMQTNPIPRDPVSGGSGGGGRGTGEKPADPPLHNREPIDFTLKGNTWLGSTTAAEAATSIMNPNVKLDYSAVTPNSKPDDFKNIYVMDQYVFSVPEHKSAGNEAAKSGWLYKWDQSMDVKGRSYGNNRTAFSGLNIDYEWTDETFSVRQPGDNDINSIIKEVSGDSTYTTSIDQNGQTVVKFNGKGNPDGNTFVFREDLRKALKNAYGNSKTDLQINEEVQNLFGSNQSKYGSLLTYREDPMSGDLQLSIRPGIKELEGVINNNIEAIKNRMLKESSNDPKVSEKWAVRLAIEEKKLETLKKKLAQANDFIQEAHGEKAGEDDKNSIYNRFQDYTTSRKKLAQQAKTYKSFDEISRGFFDLPQSVSSILDVKEREVAKDRVLKTLRGANSRFFSETDQTGMEWEQRAETEYQMVQAKAFDQMFDTSYGWDMGSAEVVSLIKNSKLQDDADVDRMFDIYMSMLQSTKDNTLPLSNINENWDKVKASYGLGGILATTPAENKLLAAYYDHLIENSGLKLNTDDPKYNLKKELYDKLKLTLTRLGRTDGAGHFTLNNGKLDYKTSAQDKQKMYNEEFDKLVGSSFGTDEASLDHRIYKYFKAQSEAKKNWGHKTDLYHSISPADTDKKGMDEGIMNVILMNMRNEAYSSKPIKHMLFHETSDGKYPVLKEEWNRQEILDAYNSLKDTEGYKGKSYEDFLKQNVAFRGLTFDQQNEESPFNLVFDLQIPQKDGNIVTRKLEIEYSGLSNSVLSAMGTPAVMRAMGKHVITGLKENDNLYFDLPSLTSSGGKTRFYTAPYDMNLSNVNIRRGEVYMIDNGDPDQSPFNMIKGAKVTKFTNYVEAVNHHMKNTAYGPNKDEVMALQELRQKLLNIEMSYANNPRKRDLELTKISQLYGIKSGALNSDMIYKQIAQLMGHDPSQVGTSVQSINTPIQKGTGTNFNTTSTNTSIQIDLNKIKENNSNNLMRSNNWISEVPVVAGSNQGTYFVQLNKNAFDNNFNKFRKEVPIQHVVSEALSTSKNAKALKASIEKYGLYQAEDGEHYYNMPANLEVQMIDPSKFQNINVRPGVRTEFDKNIRGFLDEADVAVNKYAPGLKLTIGSGRRSFERNFWTYRDDLNSVTDSRHIKGQAIDISTDAGDVKENRERILNFFASKEGRDLMKKYNLRAFYHAIRNGEYHIDLAVTEDKNKIGELIYDK